MKIRIDFVSNSSSSSFMLVGACFNNDEIKDAWLKLHPEDSEKVNEDPDDYDICDLAYDLADELCLKCERGIDNYYEDYVLGLPYDEMKYDETKAQFEERIRSSLNKAFIVNEIGECLDGGC